MIATEINNEWAMLSRQTIFFYTTLDFILFIQIYHSVILALFW